jgi:hypothetical protein
MERKEGWIKAGYVKILWVVMVVFLCVVPSVQASVEVPAVEEWYIDYDVLGILDVWGTANVVTDFYAAWGIYAYAGSTVNIWGGTIGYPYWITVSTQVPPTVTVYGTGFAVDSGIIEPDGSWTPGGGSGTLTGTYQNGDPISLLFYSTIPIYLDSTGTPPPPPPPPPIYYVDIDIKPGSYPNAINLGSNGVIPVAILSSDTFDATTVNPETVSLAGLAGVAVRGKGSKLLASEEDVNGDGLPDLIVKIDTENLAPGDLQSGSVLVTGTTFEGQDVEGQDDIVIVPPE